MKNFTEIHLKAKGHKLGVYVMCVLYGVKTFFTLLALFPLFSPLT